jgi:Tol biopolymer transport system component
VLYAAQPEGDWDLYGIPRGGGEPKQLTRASGKDDSPSWNPTVPEEAAR